MDRETRLAQTDIHTEAMREYERQRHVLETVATNTEAHLVYLDRDFNFLWVNPAYAKACARAPEEFIGHNHFEFYPHEENQAIFERVRDTGIGFEAKEKPFVFADHPEWGVTYWDWTLTPIKDESGNVESLVLSLMDVTHDVVARQEIERLRAEAESRAAEMEALMEAVPAAVMIAHDPEGKHITGNLAAYELLRLPPGVTNLSNLAPRPLNAPSYRPLVNGVEMAPEDLPVMRAARGVEVRNCEYDIAFEDGEVRRILGNASPIRDEDENVRGGIAAFVDITQRRTVEELLMKYQMLSGRSRDIILFAARDGRIIEANEAAASAYGYTRDELLGLTISDLRDSEALQTTRDEMAQADSEGILFETVHRRKDGYKFPVEVSSRGADIGGEWVLLSIIREITERKKAEEALRLSEAKWEQTFDTVPDLLAILDCQHRIVRVNRAMAERLGVTPEQCIGLKCHEAVHGATCPPLICPHVQTCRDGKEHVAEVFEPNLGGHFLVSTTPMADDEGKLVGAVHVARDITERKLAEEALRDSEIQVRTIVENLTEGVVVSDLDGNLLHWNRAAIEMHGFSSEEEGKRQLAELLTVFELSSPDGSVLPLDQWPLARILRGENLREMEVRIRRIDSDWERVFSYGGTLARVSADRPLMAVVTLRDVTEHKKWEEEQQKLNRTLKALGKSSQAMMRAVEETDYLDEVCRIITQDCGHAMVWIGMAEDDEEKSVRPAAYAGFEEGYLETLKLNWVDTERGRGPTGTAIRTGQPSVCRNMLTDPQFEPWREEAIRRGYMSSLVLPLMTEGKAFGAVSMYSSEPDAFSKDEIELLDELADDLAHGITAIRLRVARAEAERGLAEARAEAEHRAAEMQSFMNNVEEGMSLVDAGGELIWMNRAGRELFEVSEDEDFRDWTNWFQRLYLNGDEIPLEETVYSRCLRGETVKDFQYKSVTPRGKEVVLSLTGSPLQDGTGRIVGVTHVFRDVGEKIELEKQRSILYEREHHIAEILQSAIIPPSVPSELFGCRIATRYRPALQEAQVGGDFFDVFDIGEGKVGILIGDVAGKGLAAAIRVAAARYAIRAYAYLDPRPARVMTMANDALSRDAYQDSSMLTAFFAVVDTHGGTMAYTSAGHEPPIVAGADGRCEELNVGGMAMGVKGGITYSQTTRRLNPDDLVVMVTDGITEARADKRVLYGKDRLLELVCASCGASPDEMAHAVLQAATQHAGGKLQDDVAIVVFSAGQDSQTGEKTG